MKVLLPEDENEKVIDTAAKGNWFSSGYTPARKYREEMEKRATGKRVLSFWVEEDKSAVIRFLTDEPINVMEHSIMVSGKYQQRTCLRGTGEECPLCQNGNKPRFVGVYCVIDRRTYEWDDNKGKKHHDKDVVKMWKCGQRVLGQLERMHAKMGTLKGYDIEVSRTGAGKDSTYNFIPSPASRETALEGLKPLNLVEALKPGTREELLNELGILAAKKADDNDVVQSF